MRVLVHVGYHKTGTTWFQRRYLPTHPHLSAPLSYGEIVAAIAHPHDLEFDAETVRRLVALRAGAGERRPVVLSAERLCGAPHAGGHDSARIAQRISDVFPDARIWIGLREQGAVLASMYRHYVVREHGSLSLERYVAGGVPELALTFRLDHHAYTGLVERYRDLFGPERVLVTLYEDFRRDPDGVMRSLNEFVEVPHHPVANEEPENAGASDRTTALLRMLNRVTRPHADPALDALGHQPAVALPGGRMARRLLRELDVRSATWRSSTGLRDRVERLVGDRFDRDNTRLADLLDLDLEARGWRLA